jgi:arginase
MKDNVLLSPYFLDTRIAAMDAMLDQPVQLNLPEQTADDMQGRMSQVHVGIADFVDRTLRAGDRPVPVSGDCCATIGVLAGLQRAGVDPLLVWLDSHGDINDWDTTPSGFLGGMPLAMMCGIGEQRMMNAVGARPLAGHRVVLSDGRDLDPGEVVHIARARILHVPDPATLLKLRLPNVPIWVHFDSDVQRLEDMPAAKYPAQGGPSLDVLRAVAAHLAATGRVVCVSMTPWSTDMDLDGRARRNTLSVFQALLN